jgi:hypothetical protein
MGKAVKGLRRVWLGSFAERSLSFLREAGGLGWVAGAVLACGMDTTGEHVAQSAQEFVDADLSVLVTVGSAAGGGIVESQGETHGALQLVDGHGAIAFTVAHTRYHLQRVRLAVLRAATAKGGVRVNKRARVVARAIIFRPAATQAGALDGVSAGAAVRMDANVKADVPDVGLFWSARQAAAIRTVDLPVTSAL